MQHLQNIFNSYMSLTQWLCFTLENLLPHLCKLIAQEHESVVLTKSCFFLENSLHYFHLKPPCAPVLVCFLLQPKGNKCRTVLNWTGFPFWLLIKLQRMDNFMVFTDKYVFKKSPWSVFRKSSKPRISVSRHLIMLPTSQAAWHGCQTLRGTFTISTTLPGVLNSVSSPVAASDPFQKGLIGVTRR